MGKGAVSVILQTADHQKVEKILLADNEVANDSNRVSATSPNSDDEERGSLSLSSAFFGSQ